MAVMTKLLCLKCRTEKPVSEFHKDLNKKRKYKYFCKVCRRSEKNKTCRVFYKLIEEKLSLKYAYWKKHNGIWMLWFCGESDPHTNYLFKKQGYLITQVSEKFCTGVTQLLNSSSSVNKNFKKMISRLFPTETGQHLRKHYEGYEQ